MPRALIINLWFDKKFLSQREEMGSFAKGTQVHCLLTSFMSFPCCFSTDEIFKRSSTFH